MTIIIELSVYVREVNSVQRASNKITCARVHNIINNIYQSNRQLTSHVIFICDVMSYISK